MRTEPTAQELRQYDEQGFLSVPSFLDDRELEQWRAAVDGAVAQRKEQVLPFVTERARGRRTDEDQRYYERVFTQRINLWQSNDAIRALVFQPGLGQFVGRLAEVAGLRIWTDQALIKEPYGNPTGYHLDVPFWSFSSPDAITIWLALDDATLENGCLYYVPGSHKAAKFELIDIGRDIGALYDIYPEWHDVQAVPCPVPAGGALLHNGLTFHGAGANMTPGSRRAMTVGFMPDGATFNGTPNILPPHYLASLHVGDVLDNESQNPLVYRRRENGA
jgi:phytanoyl-CoA hydroxylase